MTLPKYVLDKINREANLYSRPFERVPSFQDVAVEKYKAGATVWAERCMKLREALEKIQTVDCCEEHEVWSRSRKAILAFDEDIKK